jgi:hypothetical protein
MPIQRLGNPDRRVLRVRSFLQRWIVYRYTIVQVLKINMGSSSLGVVGFADITSRRKPPSPFAKRNRGKTELAL